jgi:antitoxin FitA
MLMATLQVKNVPEALHRRIRAHARRRGRSLRDFILESVVREVERQEFRTRLARRAPVELGRLASEALRDVREEREQSLRP